MKTKHNVFVPVGSQQEAEMQHSVLKAMKQPIYSGKGFDNPNYLCFWSECNEWYFMEGNVPNNRTQITFGELIDLLSKPEKIAVKVENEREFKALMKYYDGLGLKWFGGENPKNNILIPNSYPDFVRYENNFTHTRSQGFDEKEGYTIIPFQDFAREHNIKVPLIISQDGVELFEGDKPCWVSERKGEWEIILESNIISIDNICCAPNYKIFSTKESALKWIEEQKPKEVEVKLFDRNVYALVSAKEILFKWKNGSTHILHKIMPSDIEAISKAMEDLGC